MNTRYTASSSAATAAAEYSSNYYTTPVGIRVDRIRSLV